ncbi:MULTISPECIES: hypothetical protein [Candidatus Nitrosocaldus]|jgi:hypothetical protein|uniref:Uncharacterized protein n=1 Tax=Candidatus Nitrosocaldus cavascurensis TaxID=2058097 RepID=A0A2K5ATF3_9ARCH|nr:MULTISPECIES: hypothetical protein [Candidatus Nitrosocaldus]SPC34917.1 protein of unknown function [Candidatus Nitrosocaldus cavascurensis]
MPIPAAELDESNDPVLIIKEFLKRNSDEAWTQEEISEHTGLDMTTVYQICQMLRARYVESIAREEYFPIRAVERYGQTYYAWNPKGKGKSTSSARKGRGKKKSISAESANINATDANMNARDTHPPSSSSSSL